MTFERVDLTTPWVAYWVGLLALVVGVGLVGGGLWRERRHRRFSAATARNVDLRLVEDARRQRLVGWIALGAAAVAVAAGAWLHVAGLSALRDNLAAKYGATAVEDVRQSGQGVVADLTLPDGTVEQDAYIDVAVTGEPAYGADLLEPTATGG